jgi:hypothetical protein
VAKLIAGLPPALCLSFPLGAGGRPRDTFETYKN